MTQEREPSSNDVLPAYAGRSLRFFIYYRDLPNGERANSLLQHWCPDAEAAMRHFNTCEPVPTEPGWYAEMVSPRVTPKWVTEHNKLARCRASP